MNVLFITENYSPNNYGVTTVLSQLAKEIAHHYRNTRLIIVSTGSDKTSLSDNFLVEYITPLMNNPWRWSPGLLKKLDDIILHYHPDLIHIHGVWMAIQWAALMIASNRKIPCIVSSHGMLEPWLWNKQSLLQKYKKKIYFNLVFRHAVAENTIFHAITSIEKDSLHKLLPKQKTVVIPNAIGLDKENAHDNAGKIAVPEKTFLFLGRLHPVKGVDLLVNAFYRANLDSKWRLVLAGPESVPQYAEKIKAAVLNLGLSNRVEFTGPIFGANKQELIRKAWVVVIPSYSEVMGMVNLEASACMVPSITTFETGLWDWEDGGGLLIHPNVDELTRALREVSSWSLSERIERGEKSHRLVNDKYSWDAVFPDWEKLYTEAVKGNVDSI